jgi:hypothetical protein
LGFTLADYCVTTNGTMSCGPESELAGTPPTDLGPGTLQLSRNGRWAVASTPNGTSNATLIDLSSGQTTQIPPLVIGVNLSVASDGTVLVQKPVGNGFQIGLWNQGLFTPLTVAPPDGLRPGYWL